MPEITYKADGTMDLGKHTISGFSIKNLSEVLGYEVSEENGAITHNVSFKNGGSAVIQWSADGKQASLNTKSLSQTISDDPEQPGGVIFTLAASKQS